MIEVLDTSETIFQRGAEALHAKNYAQAFADLSRAAEANYAPALHLLGRMYQGHQGIPEDRAKARELFRRGAQLNHKACRKMLEIYYKVGLIPLPGTAKYIAQCRQDWQQSRVHRARKQVKIYAEKSPLTPMFFVVHYHSVMMEPTSKKISELYNKDANSFFEEFLKDTLLSRFWHRTCLIYLFKHEDRLSYENHKILVQEMHINKINIQTPYPSEDMNWLLDAATHGDVDAQFTLGVICLNGENGFEKNKPLAKKYFNLAAEQHHIEAQYQSAFLADDEFERVKWLHCAAKNGDKDAQYNMGVALSNGEGIGRDDMKATKWFRRAAKQGDEKAKENLQLLYKEKRILLNVDESKHYRYDCKKLKISAAKSYLENSYRLVNRHQAAIFKLEEQLFELTPLKLSLLHDYRFGLAKLYLTEDSSKAAKKEAMEYLANTPKEHEKFAEAQRLFEKYKSHNQNGHPLTTFYPAVRNVDDQPQQYNAVTVATLVENTANMNNSRRG